MVKRRLHRLLLCIGCVIIISSCGIYNKDSYLKSFEEFIVEMEQKDRFSDAEITSAKKDFLDYTETYYRKYENELSNNDKEQIIKFKARYYAVMTKQGLKEVGSSLKELGEQASEFINNILE